jgi:hypothetical protein
MGSRVKGRYGATVKLGVGAFWDCASDFRIGYPTKYFAPQSAA